MTRLESQQRSQDTTSTFMDNMRLPVHGWYRFSAGFSSAWVQSIVAEQQTGKGEIILLDPFAGVGSAVLAGEEAGVASYGLEAQPYVFRIAKAKLLWSSPVEPFLERAQAVAEDARSRCVSVPEYPKLIQGCYPKEVLQDLHSLKCSWARVADDSPASELVWLALTGILRECSPAGTAPWQYVLPKKSKAQPESPFEAFAAKVNRMASDMRYRQMLGVEPLGKVFYGDARDCAIIEDRSINLVVTSPPYANNYDYADATRLEMTFFGEVQGWGDLHEKARQGLLRSCSQHVSAEHTDLGETLASLAGSPICSEVEAVCAKLEAERLNHGGRKAYHTMIAAYFADMVEVWQSLRRACMQGASICLVVGDSAPYGVHVPVERWLGELAMSAGFTSFVFEKTRDRNVKWKNRKHRVPLHEGRLWVEG